MVDSQLSDGSRRALLSVVIPFHNERRYIEGILGRVQTVDISKEMIVVDDCSSDGTSEWLLQLHRLQAAGAREVPVVDRQGRLRIDKILFLFQEKEQGKGAALSRRQVADIENRMLLNKE